MQKSFYKILFFLFGFVLFCLFSKEALSVSLDDFGKVQSRDNSNVIYGSALNKEANEVRIFFPRGLISQINRSAEAKIELFPESGLIQPLSTTIKANLARNRSTSRGEFIVVNLGSFKNTNEQIVSPFELPSDNYRMHIIAPLSFDTLDLTTGFFRYESPALVSGVVDSNTPSFITIEDLGGNIISETVVKASPGEAFISEVRVNKLTKDGDNEQVVIIHAISEKDLLGLAILKNTPEHNLKLSDNPIKISEASTFAAKLARENKEKAKEIAMQGLQEKKEEIPHDEASSLECDIAQFKDFCDLEDEGILSNIGESFKEFLASSICDRNDFLLTKIAILLASDNSNLSVGKSYCENFLKGFDLKKLCVTYVGLLKKFKKGEIESLPCPPEVCKEFKDIKPPACTEDKKFCEDGSEVLPGGSCIIKPQKDLYCLKLLTPEDKEICKSDPNGSKETALSNGTVVCVPSSFDKERSEFECKLRECHDNCEAKNDNNNKEATEACHKECEFESSRLLDCSSPNSKYFSFKCCDPNAGLMILIGGNIVPSSLRLALHSRVSDLPSLRNCLCKSESNFNEKGFVKEEAKTACENICPEGFIQNEIGNCVCKDCKPPAKECLKGEKLNIVTGKCEKEIKCGKEQFVDEFGICRCKSDGSIPQNGECKKEVGLENICPTGTGPSSIIKCICNPPAVAVGSECKCPEGQIYLGRDGCKKQDKMIEEGNICPAGTGPSQTIPCKCASPATVVGSECFCGEGKKYVGIKGCVDEIKSDIPLLCAPGQFKSSIIPCKCASGAEFNEDGLCKCLNGQTYTIQGCSEGIISTPKPTPLLTPKPLPTSTPSASTVTCKTGEKPSNTGCTCAGGTTTGSDSTCQCKSTDESYTIQGCTTIFCAVNQTSTTLDPCVCKGTATPTGPSGECVCPGGRDYSPTFGGCP